MWSIKFPLFYIYLGFLGRSKCAVTQSPTPLSITMSPGFLPGALPYVGHEECTEAGTCKTIPSICLHSSCCISYRNTSLPNAFANSHCGCWDSKRRTCKPISNFRLEWETCSPRGDAHVKTNFELTSAEDMAAPCVESWSSVEIGIDPTAKMLSVRVTNNLCLPKGGRKKLDIPFLSPNASLFVQFNIGPYSPDFELKIKDAVPASVLSRTSTNKLLDIFSNFAKTSSPVDKKFECNYYLENSTVVISMCPSFLPVSVPNFLSQNSEVCSIQGNCKESTPGCETKGCCLMSSGRNFSGCDCMTNSGNCLLDHKVFNVGGLAWTTSGERVKNDLKIKIPSNDLSECSGYSDSPSIQFTLNEAGNVEIAVETEQCILSNVNKKYLQVESKVAAEINIDQFLEVIQKLH